MKANKYDANQRVTSWVGKLLNDQQRLLSLPLSKDTKSPWNVNLESHFIAKEASVTISEAHRRRHLTLPLIEKMSKLDIIIKDATSRENIVRHRILDWYNQLTFDNKTNLPRSKSCSDNICLRSIGKEQSNWLYEVDKYQLIAKTIDEVHEDLLKLGVIGPHFKRLETREPREKNAKNLIIRWVSETIDDIETLWNIPITKANTPLGFNISTQYLLEAIGLSYSSAYEYRYLAYPLIERMVEQGVLVTQGSSKEIQGIEIRKRLSNWYRRLSKDDKLSLPIFANKISLKRIPSDQRPINKSDFRYSAVKEAWQLIHADLEELGVIDANYKSVAEREVERLNKAKKRPKSQKEYFKQLELVELNNFSDFINPSQSEPFIQVEQLFASRAKAVSSDSGKSNYRNASSLFIEFLAQTHGDKPMEILEVFDDHILSKYRKNLQQQIISNKTSSHHANTILSCVRNALYRLAEVRGTKYSFFDINGFEAVRETNTKKPFSKYERNQILKAIDLGIADSREHLKPYIKTGTGQNPLRKDVSRILGLSTIENARWLFENELNCKPVHYNTAESPVEKAFLQIITDSNEGLMDVYNQWGVVPLIGIDILVPYLLKLAQVTGLNSDSLLSLDIDDYIDSHPATSRPCLRYWKERSDGHKEYHLDLFKAELTWLTYSQSQNVKEIFEEVIDITSDFRDFITNNDHKNRLFIYQSNGRKAYGRASVLLGNNEQNTSVLGNSLARFVNKYNLESDEGGALTLNISRFRPTFASEMLDNGVSLREIQLMLGHSSIQTTIQYLDTHDFNSISRGKLENKIKEIHDNTVNHQNTSFSEIEDTKDNDDTISVSFSTPLAQCKNIFDPPQFVKDLSSYTPGTPCSQYNKCLSCDNVIITAKNLPEIFAMKRGYTLLIENSRVMDTPYGHVVKENLGLINSIIDPELSDFSITELQDGERLAEYIDTTMLVDGAI